MIPTPQQQEEIDNLNAGQLIKFNNTFFWVSYLGESFNREVRK